MTNLEAHRSVRRAVFCSRVCFSNNLVGQLSSTPYTVKVAVWQCFNVIVMLLLASEGIAILKRTWLG